MDKAGVSYWERHWSQTAASGFVPTSGRLRDYRDTVLAKLLDEATRGLRSGSLVLEAGCADSVLLPYLAMRGFRIAGIDYSEAGCRKFRERLGSIEADIECCDIFAPPARLIGAADLVISYGLAEHFTRTDDCVRAIAALVKANGRVLTIIPNMRGTLGVLQRWLAPSIYAAHVPISCTALREAHVRAGLVIERSAYLLPMGYGVLDAREPGTTGLSLLLRRTVRAGLARLSWATWAIDRITRLPTTEAFSPYAFCLATRRR